MRLRIAQRLKDSQNTYAMLTTFNEVDMRYAIGGQNALCFDYVLPKKRKRKKSPVNQIANHCKA